MTRIFHSPYPPLNVPTDRSVSQFLLECNPDDVHGSKTIVSDFDNDSASEPLTYGSIRSKAARCAYALRRNHGLKEGETVCIVGKNSVNWVLLAHALMWAGSCFSAINPAATSFELEHYFAIAEPTLVAVDASQLNTIEAALKNWKGNIPPRVVLIDDRKIATDDTELPIFPRDFLQNESLKVYDLSRKDNRHIPVAMCFSSGTSGSPKGVLISHYNLIAYALTLRSTSPSTTNIHTSEVFFPSFAHIYGIVIGVLAPVFSGGSLVAMRDFDFLPYLRKAAEIRATILRLVPATAIRLIKDPEAKILDLSSVQTVYCAGASLESAVAQSLQTMLNCTSILNGYGMSEGTISMLKEPWSEQKAGSVGKPASGNSIRVVDDNFNDVPIGMDGECLWKGPTLFMGYKSNAEETRNSFHDGWLCTGDVVRMDEDGFFFITGRKKELIKFKGNQVPPAEIEGVLLAHPLVTDAGVCGIYDRQLESELPVGYVSLDSSVRKDDHDKVLGEVKAFVNERVARYKQLRGGLFHLAEMPKNHNGKLMRRELPAKKEEIRRSKL